MKLDRRFVKFLLVGLLNTAFGSTIYVVLIYARLPIWAALLGGNLAGIVFNFFTTGHLVFSDAVLARLPRFVGAYLACYIINYISIRILVFLYLSAILSQLLLALPMAALSFYLMSRHVFVSRVDR